VSAIAVIGALALAVAHLDELGPKLDRALNGEEPTRLPGGQTRLSSLSLTGRTQIWRVALDSYREAPVLGHGSGSFTAIFTRDRTNKDLYVLQPHSIELEVLDELGIPGACGFAGFIILLVIGLIRGRGPRPARAAALGVVVVLIGQASVDWTFSFPALVVAVLLVVGAATGPGSFAVRATPALLGGAAIGAVALLALAGPLLATRHLADAKAAIPQKAWPLLRQARGFDPWNAEVVDYQGQVAEEAGRYQDAARLYGHAATLARLSWLEEYRSARALHEGHFIPAAKAACRRAQALNPLERLLEQGPCSGVH
jgi:tetratricopeptide (TPR) repeat protein